MVEPFVMHYNASPVIRSLAHRQIAVFVQGARARIGEALTFGGEHSSIAILSAS